MTHFGSGVLCAGLAAALLACGSGGKGGSGIENLFPRNDTVAGWMVDQSDNNSVASDKIAAVATSQSQAEVDFQLGSAVEPFYAGFSPRKLAMQSYVNSNLGGTVLVFVVEMPAVDQAAALYSSLLGNSAYSSSTWEEPSNPVVGTASRIADTGTTWWVNLYQGVYYVELRFYPSGGDVTTKADALEFAQAIASKI